MLRLAVLTMAACVAMVAYGVEGSIPGRPGNPERDGESPRSGCYRPCRDGQICYRGGCQCPVAVGYRDAGPCCESRCLNGGTCSGRNRCTCRSGYTGYRCQIKTCSRTCQNRGVCKYGSCSCKPEYSGSYCQIRVCSPSCRNGQHCVNGHCQCPESRYPRGAPGSRGGPDRDYPDGGYERPCCDRDCLNGGTCSGHNRCTCRYGYTGSICQTRINRCSPTCRNGGVCNYKYGSCSCKPEYSGSYCQIRVCSPSCRNGQRCVKGICTCPSTRYPRGARTPLGYPGRDYPDGSYHEPCCDRDCLNGGTCSGRNKCTCRAGYTGSRCQSRC